MKPLAVLLLTFGRALAATWRGRGQPDWRLAGNVALGTIPGCTGVAHLPCLAGMGLLLPAGLPGRRAWVLGTGVLKVALGPGLLAPATRERAEPAAFFWCWFSGQRAFRLSAPQLPDRYPRRAGAALPLVLGAATGPVYRLGLALRAAPSGVAGATL